jgi:transcriptional regulator with XRE-family HTH domain
MRDANVLIGARVKEARLARGLNQSDIAKALGLQIMAISKKESGANVITAEQLAKISKLLRKPVGWFLEDIR